MPEKQTFFFLNLTVYIFFRYYRRSVLTATVCVVSHLAATASSSIDEKQEALKKKTNRLRLKCDGTRAETRFRLSAKQTSPFKSARASFQSTIGSRGVRISGNNGSNAGYTMFRSSLKRTGYPLDSPVSPSLPLSCVTMCHHISTGLYFL